MPGASMPALPTFQVAIEQAEAIVGFNGCIGLFLYFFLFRGPSRTFFPLSLDLLSDMLEVEVIKRLGTE